MTATAPLPRHRRRRTVLLRWAVVLTAVLAALVGAGWIFAVHVLGSVKQTDLLGADAATRHADITGPVNVLLVGTDQRADQPVDAARSDSIIALHVTADHRTAYLISIPRDTLVHLPADPATGFAGGTNKINAAFQYGSQRGGGISGGVKLLAETIRTAYGIRFDAASVVDFAGFQQVVDALGGVNMCIDERTTSIHAGLTAAGKPAQPFTEDSAGRLHPVRGVTPVVYEPGCRHLSGAQALDYVRQRNLLARGDGDYGRQRHQQQFLEAVLAQTGSAGTLADPVKLDRVLTTVGHSMTVDTGGVSLPDWIFDMRGLNGGSVQTIRTNDGKFDSVNVPGLGSCQLLTAASRQLLHDVTTDSVGTFLAAHPDWRGGGATGGSSL
ncbi:LCP family protein [Paractinoplanes ferrugineus]|uniref:Transcriptional regulator n=1 Tax=Paractinoplanes ferrugineus TaxID=113564 RepID=A0A919MHZ9_9ACTN|nr:LCP family protein [Actinoplanes ferrugineus]GIE16353.1 transcriptional regulator [Actinoplanes ferrugineus]